jgi:Protein of unknown function (DUF3574)
MLIRRLTLHAGIMRPLLIVALCLSPITLSSSGGETGSCSKGVISRLYLGQSTPLGAVSDTQWRSFIGESVTPRFPAGFTELQAQGHWRDDRGTVIEEDTRIVEVVHDGALSSRRRLRAVADDYKQRFAQQSVLITQSTSLHCF